MRLCSFLIALLVSAQSVGAAEPNIPPSVPLENSNIAQYLLELESQYGDGTEADLVLLNSIQKSMIASLSDDLQEPQSREEALVVLDKFATAMARHNLLQPQQFKNWPDTLGVAFDQKKFSEQELNFLLLQSGNSKRSKFIDRASPFYFVDCDMGALIIVSTAQKLGWDIRLVTVPNHAFVRWHLPSGERVNWDWTHWDSFSDSHYLSGYPFSKDHVSQGMYLFSYSLEAARGHFLGLLAVNTKNGDISLDLKERSIQADPHSPLTQNNYAWEIAIHPSSTSQDMDKAILYGLRGWSGEYRNGNSADTLACAFSRKGEKQMALALADFAIGNAKFPGQAASFRKNRVRIENGEICK